MKYTSISRRSKGCVLGYSVFLLVTAPAQAQTTTSVTAPSALTISAVPTLPTVSGTPAIAEPVATQSVTCQEHLPEGKERPPVSERFPLRGITGHATWLKLRIKHGSGETVLPSGFEFQKDSEAAKALEAAGFMLPDAKGPARVRVKHISNAAGAETRISLAVVPLPKKPGRSELTLPPLPIAMARSSGEVITLCTAPHTITVEDPIANQPDAQPHVNAKPTRQTEVWDSLRTAVYGGLLGLALASLAALGITWWRRRPKLVPPPPPPRPAWEVALESLHDIRQSRLVEQGRLNIHLERTSHALRKYLGGRFGFESLESTSEELLEQLRHHLPKESYSEVQQFLSETDLVKFADVRPTEAQCHWALEHAESLVHRTIPKPRDLSGDAAAIERGLDDAYPRSGDSDTGGAP
jgi:hypothetical protein